MCEYRIPTHKIIANDTSRALLILGARICNLTLALRGFRRMCLCDIVMCRNSVKISRVYCVLCSVGELLRCRLSGGSWNAINEYQQMFLSSLGVGWQNLKWNICNFVFRTLALLINFLFRLYF